MIWRGRWVLCLFICFLFLQAATLWPPQQDAEESIARKLLQQKVSAVHAKNLQRFLSVLDHQNRFYVQEQKRWFADAIKVIESNSYQLTLLRIKIKQKDRFHIEVKQSYRQNGKQYELQMPLVIRKTKNGWKESGYPFFRRQNGPIQILYTTKALEESANIALDIIQRALYVMEQRYQWKPKRVEVKLYHDAELFRQSVKPSLPAWSGGWNEAGQAIKLVVDQQHPKLYAAGLVHELAHQMVSDLTNDNAAYWLQEGAAMYYEKHLLPRLSDDFSPIEEQLPAKYSYSDLKRLDLERLPDQAATQYYLSCYQFFRFLLKKHGEEKIKNVFKDLKKYPYLDLDSNRKKALLNIRTEKAIKQELKIRQLDQDWKKKD